MFKKLLLFSLIFAIPGLRAMEVLPEAVWVPGIIEHEDIPALKALIESNELNPNQNQWYTNPVMPNAERKYGTPLKLAVEYALNKASGGLKVIQYLLPLSDDRTVLSQLPIVLSSYRGEYQEQRSAIQQMFMDEVKKRNLNIQNQLDKALDTAVSQLNPERVRYLLSMGAHRTKYDLINTLNEILKYARDDVEYHCAQEMIHLLRTYAPDLKTRIALNILNQIREGKIGRAYFNQQNLPNDLIELMAKLASVDSQAEEKWIELGMPVYPFGFMELPEETDEDDFE